MGIPSMEGLGLRLETHAIFEGIGIFDAFGMTRKCIARDALPVEPADFIGFFALTLCSSYDYAMEVQYEISSLRYGVDTQ